MIRVGFSLNFLRFKVVSYLEGVISSETGRLGKMVINSVERMDEIDHMYDDMQDRVFEIDKNRKNNLVGQISHNSCSSFLEYFKVFYGVKGEETDQDECERMIKSIMNKFMQVRDIKNKISRFLIQR